MVKHDKSWVNHGEFPNSPRFSRWNAPLPGVTSELGWDLPILRTPAAPSPKPAAAPRPHPAWRPAGGCRGNSNTFDQQMVDSPWKMVDLMGFLGFYGSTKGKNATGNHDFSWFFPEWLVFFLQMFASTKSEMIINLDDPDDMWSLSLFCW